MVVVSIFNSAEMSSELVPVLVDMIFKTLCIYDDRGSRKAVDDVITKALGEVTFMKSFAATVVQLGGVDSWALLLILGQQGLCSEAWELVVMLQGMLATV
ncbi:Protein ILITYHIA [Camellia lanceoleosa]|uniref:Protein ILITYHIA n=1 Tax=Camellia lanceoleosa TaxID=1840588 RepID=A0ACC0GHZ6_9ERIC|nr:Protein ILITYHIA [Camellia lanceoleosa]